MLVDVQFLFSLGEVLEQVTDAQFEIQSRVCMYVTTLLVFLHNLTNSQVGKEETFYYSASSCV